MVTKRRPSKPRCPYCKRADAVTLVERFDTPIKTPWPLPSLKGKAAYYCDACIMDFIGPLPTRKKAARKKVTKRKRR